MFKRKFLIGLVLVVIGISFIVKTVRKVGLVKKVERFDFDAIETIDVKAHNVIIEIIPTTDKIATLELVGETSKLQRFTANKKGSTFVVKVRTKWQNLFKRVFSPHISSLKIYIPERNYKSIYIEASNGDINLTSIHSDNVKIISDNGKINLTDVDGTLVVEADNGDISLITNYIDRDIDFKTDNAEIVIQTEVEPKNVLFDVKTGDGKTDVFGRDDCKVIIGDGKNMIRLKTDNGGITVNKS